MNSKTGSNPGTVREAATAIRRKLQSLKPRLAIVLGSGFKAATDAVEIVSRMPYRTLPGFQTSGVPGHGGELLVGRLSGVPVIVCSGRIHYYEGHSMETVTHPVRVLAALGVQDLLLTNAAGGINSNYRPGEFMLLTDHLNFMGDNPLRGSRTASSSPFIDLSKAYDGDLNKTIQRAARTTRVKLHRGIYLAVSGPSYETPAEIRAFRKLGADAVGMSTVPETIVARACGIRVAGISCITNPAAGLSGDKLSHDDVLKVGSQSTQTAVKLLSRFAEYYGDTVTG